MITTTRRDLARIALTAFPAAQALLQAAAAAAKPNSRFGGVQIGINAPYSFRGLPADADSVLKTLIDLNLSAVELRSQPIEAACGAPITPGINFNPNRRNPTPEQVEEARQRAEAIEKWRLAAGMDQFQAFRKKWEAAGVKLEIIKFDAVDRMKDEVVDYMFRFGKALGAKAISCEIPVSKTKWLGELAAKHQMRVGYHGHGDVKNPEAFATPESWERSMSYSKYNCINLDIGHFTAGNSTSPIPFIKKHPDRITHIHLKDRKLNNGPNQVWGQGDTPIREVLLLMKKEKYPFQATIEFEYPVPEGSTLLAEIGKCVAFCREALA